MTGSGSCLIYAHNTGGAEVLTPLVLRMSSSEGTPMDVIANEPARAVFRRAGVEHTALSELASPPLDLARARRIVSSLGSTWAVLGVANRRDPANACLTLACREQGVPTIGFMDNWLNWDEMGEGPGDFQYAPDILAVMDECARGELVSRGFPEDRIEMVGHPHLESSAHIHRARHSDYLSPGDLEASVWLVVSQRVHRDRSLKDNLGLLDTRLDGEELVTILTHAAGEARKRDRRDVLIVLRPHPIERKVDREWEAVEGVTVRVDGTTSIEPLLSVSDTVIGLYGMPMLLAFYMSRRTISLAGIFGVENPCIDRYQFFEQADSPTDLFTLLSDQSQSLEAAMMSPMQKALVTGSIDRCMALLARVAVR